MTVLDLASNKVKRECTIMDWKEPIIT